MRPEQVVRIIRYKLIELIEGHVVEVRADEVHTLNVESVEVEVTGRPVEPVAYVCYVPRHRIYRNMQGCCC